MKDKSIVTEDYEREFIHQNKKPTTPPPKPGSNKPPKK